MNDYTTFLESKRLVVPSAGVDVASDALHSALFPFQRDMVRWALRKGRAALFADTGLGKTLMQLAWAQHAGRRVLILAPLGVARQTVREGERWGIPATYRRDGSSAGDGITITNYEMLPHFDPAAFDAVVLDESSILKNFEGKTRSALIAAFRKTPMRLCCTATPAPNDTAELANHAEFLGLMSRAEMLASFFVHDDNGWRLKGHAREPFYRWLASWGMHLKRPSDLGYSDLGYDLPALHIQPEIVDTDYTPAGQLFATTLKGVGDRMHVRRATLTERVARAVKIIQQSWTDSSTTDNGTCGTASENAQSNGNTGKTCLPNSEKNVDSSDGHTISQTKNASSRICGNVASDSRKQSAQPDSSRSTASASTTTKSSSASNKNNAPFAELRPQQFATDCTSTTTTAAVPSEDCYANRATWDSESSTTIQSCCTEQPNTSSAQLEKWVVWCDLNAEQDALAAALGHLCVSIDGSLSPDEKVVREERWRLGEVPVIVTKPKVFGHGMNWQNCARMVFVGLGDSYETYYQSIRRCYRFGQTREVHAYIVLTEPEEAIYANVLRKETEAESTGTELLRHVANFEKEEIGRVSDNEFVYTANEAQGTGWRMLLGDSAERLAELPTASVDLSIFSPPFGSLYTYSNTERDLGNSRTDAEFWQHFGYIIRELARVMKPGRIVCVHVAQIPSQKARDGVIGLKDFRGDTINHFQTAGLIYHGEVCIDKDPQAQAIRTKSKGLLFTQMHKDSSWSRPALADYILLFRAPGENRVPIQPDITNDEWIEWARPIWYGIRESDTLNVIEARSDDDERHICPLQLGTIKRCIRLWSNRGEMVLSLFAGIGSEGYEAILRGRRFIGVELKPEYWRVAVRNLREAEQIVGAPDLFATLEAPA